MFRFVDKNKATTNFKGFGELETLQEREQKAKDELLVELDKLPLDVQAIYDEFLKPYGTDKGFEKLLDDANLLGQALVGYVQTMSGFQDANEEQINKIARKVGVSKKSGLKAVVIDSIDEHVIAPSNLVLKYDKLNNLYRLHICVNFLIEDTKNQKVIYQPLYEIAYELPPSAVQVIDTIGTTTKNEFGEIIGLAKKTYKVNIYDRHSDFQWRKNYVLNNGFFEFMYNSIIRLLGNKIFGIQRKAAIKYKGNHSNILEVDPYNIDINYLKAIKNVLPDFTNVSTSEIERTRLPFDEIDNIGAFFMNIMIKDKPTEGQGFHVAMVNSFYRLIQKFIKETLFGWGTYYDKLITCFDMYSIHGRDNKVLTNRLIELMTFETQNMGAVQKTQDGYETIKVVGIVNDKESIPMIGIQLFIDDINIQIEGISTPKMQSNNSTPTRLLDSFQLFDREASKNKGVENAESLNRLVETQILDAITSDFALYVETLMNKRMTDSINAKIGSLKKLADQLKTDSQSSQIGDLMIKQVDSLNSNILALTKVLPISDTRIEKTSQLIAQTSQCSNRCYQQLSFANILVHEQKNLDEGAGVASSSGVSIPFVEIKHHEEVAKANLENAIALMNENAQKVRDEANREMFDRIAKDATAIATADDDTYDIGNNGMQDLEGFVLPYMGNTYVQPLGLGQIQTNRGLVNADTGLTDLEEEAFGKELDDLSMLLQAKAKSYGTISENESKFKYVPLKVESSEGVNWKKVALYGLGALSIGSLAYILYKHNKNKSK